jgi:hypothetical protein
LARADALRCAAQDINGAEVKFADAFKGKARHAAACACGQRVRAAR